MIFIGMFLLSGCISYQTSITLDKDGSGTTEVVYKFDKTSYDLANGETESLKDDLVKNGYETDIEESDDDIIVIGKKSFSDINELDLANEEADFSLETDKSFFKDTHKLRIDMAIDQSSTELDSELSSGNDVLIEGFDEFEEYILDKIEMTISVTLPEKAQSHNASEKDGKTLTWDAIELVKEDMGRESITLEADYQTWNAVSIILVLLIMGTGIAIAVNYFTNKKH